jgi:hypothetical protein
MNPTPGRLVVLALAFACGLSSGAAERSLSLDRTNNWLVIRGAHLPGGELRVNYLEAYCRAGSTDADWAGHTVIPHRTEFVARSPDGRILKLRCTLADGVVVNHRIEAKADEIDFQVTAHNPGVARSEAHWAQACPRLGTFTGVGGKGASIDDYLPKCFVFVGGRLQRMPTPDWATEARYTPGQVWCPAHVPRTDVNPRPLNPRVPDNGLIGCFSGDENLIWATAWEAYQELFQGIARCLHADFRIGGLDPGQSRKIRGKMYIVPADVDALLERYAADFPEHMGKGGRAAADAGQARLRMAAAVAVSPLGRTNAVPAPAKPRTPREPVQLARAARPAEVDGRSFDLVVVGATGGGIACAVRAAREGCSVLLVQHNGHIGGMMANGLMQWDALYGGHRSPLFTELLGNIERHYRETFGEGSKDHQVVRYTHEHYPIGWAEPHVAEREFNRLVAAEARVTLLLGHHPVAAEREASLLRGVTLRSAGAGAEIRVRGAMFADATYEGDLLPLARVPYRVGRESRGEHGEPHAGKLFCNIDHSPPRSVVREGLNIRAYGARQGSIDPASPFTGDGAVQAYNFRFCVTCDPSNRVPFVKPSGYRRDEYVDYERKYIAASGGPNRKSHVNSPILPGENHGYPEADWAARGPIIRRHLDFALGLMWFLQNDESVPEAKRAVHRTWGLPADEFPDNGHLPYEMYVREARRIVGRHMFTEHDGSLAPGLGRTPVHPDSVAFTDWYMDSHSCTTNSRPGYRYDGKLILTEESRPAQVPYRSLLPLGLDNLLVPVCLGATHVAWGSVRLEPVWMQTGEAAGFAAALAKRGRTPPARLDPGLLVRTLASRRQVVSFFSDVNGGGPEAWIPAAQVLGTQGFFHDYNARGDEPLKLATARVWARGLGDVLAGKADPNALALAVAEAERTLEPAGPEAIRDLFPIDGASAPPAGATDSVARRDVLLRIWSRMGESGR